MAAYLSVLSLSAPLWFRMQGIGVSDPVTPFSVTSLSAHIQRGGDPPKRKHRTEPTRYSFLLKSHLQGAIIRVVGRRSEFASPRTSSRT